LSGSDYRMRLVGDLAEIGRDPWDHLVRATLEREASAKTDQAPARLACSEPTLLGELKPGEPGSEAAGRQQGGSASDPLVPPPCLPAFLRYDFLHTLAQTGCVGPGTGWQPLFLTLWQSKKLVAALPLYAKSHSYGEYVFDWSWADAYERHGLDYYPKLLSAIPFTPVTGPRLLAVDTQSETALVQTLLEQARQSQLSSLHVLYPTDAQASLLSSAGLMLRRAVQFHWRNAGYRSFDDFLQTLAQPKRKKIRAERRKVAQAGIHFERLIGREILDEHWDFFASCYETTYAEHHSTPYLNREFFKQLGRKMPENLVLIVARRGQQPIASSLLVRDADRLYGRYWGAIERVDCLHFETAYYQAIETAIELGIQVLEGGAQGEHKMARGFLPQPTVSAHWLAHPEFADAVDRFLAREGNAISNYIDELHERNPFVRPSDQT
jgi:predicted N-acyltransferase